MTKDEQWLLEEKYNGEATAGFEADRTRLAKGEPVAYLIGHQPFLGLNIYLDSKPLIPRSETEWWVDQLLNTYAQDEPVGSEATVRLGRAALSDQFSLPVTRPRKMEVPLWCATEKGSLDERPVRLLDLCAGSGAIGCAALARLPNAEVYFGEIDPAHGATIAKNIRENNLDVTRATIRIGDLFEPFEKMQFDIIAANPPYVPANRELPSSVADYEPSLALYAGDDGLDFIRRIALELPHCLTPKGEAWVEVDSAHAVAACALFTDQGLNAQIRTDQYTQPRVIRVTA